MEAVISILAIVAVIWFIYFFGTVEHKFPKASELKDKKETKAENHLPNASELKKKETKADNHSLETSELKNNIPGFEKSKPTEEQAKIKSQKSLDMLYAESHGMWVCRFCETINDGGARYCDACGAKK